MNGRKLMVLLLAALALAAAGCGGDDSSDASGDTDTTVVEATTADETTTEETTTEETTTEETTLSGKCAEFAGLGAKISQAMAGGNAGLDEASELFDELASQVPDEIKADFQVIADNFADIAEVMRDIDLAPGEQPSAEDLAKLQELTSSLNSTEVTQASANIQKWTEENC